MKNITKMIVGTCCFSTLLFTGCIEETFPTRVATSDQLGSSAKATEALLWAMPAFANNYDVLGKYPKAAGYDWGYGSIMHIRDIMTEDMAVVSSSYDHYSRWAGNVYQGENYVYSQYIWNYYWKFVQTANNMISALDPATATDTQKGYLGVGYTFRAFLYLDMAQMYEFLPNDKTSSVNAKGNDVLQLTIPIVKEGMTEEDARNNPRVPRQKMYEFILSDLDLAEKMIVNLERTTKTLPDLGVVYGLKARMYMWVGDYENAKIYARKAINAGGIPMTETQWLSTTKGFNDISVSSWMWGSQMYSEDLVVQSGLLNWTSWSSNETQYGYARVGPIIMMNASLYTKMSNTDFRKRAWKAPAGSELAGKNSYLYEDQFKKFPNYASLKFRPAEGNGMLATIGSASAYPLMRVEEMYFIEAEAAAHLNESVGRELLTHFMTSYRDPSYTCLAQGEALIQEIVFQKRIELWGEGTTFFDVKRLNMPVTRGYKGTNFSPSTCFNTTTRPAWMNICIVQNEGNNNAGMRAYGNPDPSGCYTPWLDK